MATQSESSANGHVPIEVLLFVGWLIFLMGFITGLIANGFTVHVRP